MASVGQLRSQAQQAQKWLRTQKQKKQFNKRSRAAATLDMVAKRKKEIRHKQHARSVRDFDYKYRGDE